MPSRLATKIAAEYLAKRHIAVEANVKRNIESMMELIKTAQEAMHLAQQHSRGLYSESALQWIPDYVDTQFKEFKEFAAAIENAVEYITESPLPRS